MEKLWMEEHNTICFECSPINHQSIATLTTSIEATYYTSHDIKTLTLNYSINVSWFLLRNLWCKSKWRSSKT
jgi:hypothetical protein